MDTTEQLNGTYFYGGLTNLTPGELFFWVMIDVTAEHYTGAKDVMAAAAVYSGQNTIAVSGKFGKATQEPALHQHTLVSYLEDTCCHSNSPLSSSPPPTPSQ